MIGRIEKTCDYDGLAMVWDESVKSTHDFLSVEDIEFYHRRVPCDYMPEVELYAIRNDDGEWCAFIGLSAKMVEMLFVHPGAMGNGYGSALLDFAIKEKGIRRVDVNEQNLRALKFYCNRGFSISGRDDVDGEGKSYPILHLEL